MDLLALVARLTLDKSEYEKGLNDAESDASSAGNHFQKAFSGVGKVVGTAAKAGAAAIGAGSAAVGVLTKQAVDGYSNYEQLSGGVKKLFGDAYESVMQNASEAYKTSGVNANQYMEQATSFSAALINSLGGNTQEAAKLADVAMQSMSDNVNTFGSDMGSVQNAFQGFAKQNYTMLDNLKLGYGGTKEEMSRLIADAAAATDAQEKLGLSVDGTSMSFDNIVKAIQVVQYEQGIAGTTANEAATTIEGSFNMTKAAWDNLIAGFANPDADMDKLMDNLIVAVVGDKKGEGLLNQLIPAIQRAMEGIGQFVEKAGPIISQYLPGLMSTILPPLITAATTLMSGLVAGLPTILQVLIEQLPTVAQSIFDAFQQSLPLFIELGRNILNSIYNGLVEAFPQLQEPIDNVVNIFKTAFDLISNAVKFVSDNIEAFAPIVAGVVGAITGLGIVSIITGIVGAITSVASAIGGVISALSMIKSFSGLISVITTLAGGPLVLIVAAIGAVAGAFIYLWNTSEKFRNFWIGLWDKIKNTAETVGKAVSGAFNKIVETVTGVVKSIGDKFTSLKEGLSQKAKDIKENTAQKFNELKNSITDAVENARKSAVEKFESLKEAASEKWSSIKETVGNAVESLKEGASEKLESLKEKAGGIFDALKGDADDKMGGATSIVTGAFDTMLQAVGFTWGLPDLDTDAISSAYETVSGAVNDMLGALGFDWSLPDIDTLSLDNAGNLVSGFISDIMDSFSNIRLSLPDIQLPHLSVSWEDLGPISIPHISVDWYAKAYANPYMFTSPTVVGAMGFGDGVGGEIVYGHDNLMRDIREASGNNDRIEALLQTLIDVVRDQNGKQIVLDTGKLVGELTPAVDSRLGVISARRGRYN